MPALWRAFAVAGAEVHHWWGRMFDPRIVEALVGVRDKEWQRATAER